MMKDANIGDPVDKNIAWGQSVMTSIIVDRKQKLAFGVLGIEAADGKELLLKLDKGGIRDLINSLIEVEKEMLEMENPN